MNKYEDCLNRVIKAIRECKKTTVTITADTLLATELDIDSFDILMLIGELEEEFDITINENQLNDVTAVGDIVAKLEEL